MNDAAPFKASGLLAHCPPSQPRDPFKHPERYRNASQYASLEQFALINGLEGIETNRFLAKWVLILCKNLGFPSFFFSRSADSPRSRISSSPHLPPPYGRIRILTELTLPNQGTRKMKTPIVTPGVAECERGQGR